MSELIFFSDKTERAFSAVFLLLYAATCTQKRVTAAAAPVAPEPVEVLVLAVVLEVFELFVVPEALEGPLEEAVFFVVATADEVFAVSVFLTAVAFSVSSASLAFPV